MKCRTSLLAFFSASNLLVQAISNGRSSGLVDDAQHI